MDIHQQKRLIRRSILARRARLTESERHQAGQAAASRLLDLPEMQAAQTVLAFASYSSEIPTEPLIDRLLTQSRRVLVPRVEGERMLAVPIGSLEDLAPGYKGIPEPAAPAPTAPEADVIVVPGVAFTAGGTRLGYGGGFYDRYLAEATGTRIGLCYDFQIVEDLPAGPHDIPMDRIVTEARVI